MINAIKSIFKAISGFFGFINGILLPKAKELILAVGDGVKIFLRISSEFLSSMPGILTVCVSVALVVTIAKLIGGRQ